MEEQITPLFAYLLNVNEKAAASMVLQLWPQTDDGIIIFSESSLTDLIRRYEAITSTQLLQKRHNDHQQLMIAEIGKLSHECKQKQLEISLMNYTGEKLSSLASVDELEKKLESALGKVRARKDELEVLTNLRMSWRCSPT